MAEQKSAKTALAVLLGGDRGRLTLVPTRQVEITRLSKAAGEPVIFTIRALTGKEMQDAQDAAMKLGKRGELEEMDSQMLQMLCVLYATKDPNLKDKELLAMYGAATPEELFDGRFLLPGEISQLFSEIQDLSGFSEGAVAELKN